MTAHAVELEAVLFESVLNVRGTAELGAIRAVLFHHVIAGLRAGRAGFLGELEKSFKSLAAVLCAFNTAVIDRFRHNLMGFGWRENSEE